MVLMLFCATCKSIIPGSPGRPGRRRITCSSRCKNIRDQKTKVIRRGSIEKKCLSCGKSFPALKMNSREWNYCSRECSKNRPKLDRNKNKACEQCGKIFLISGLLNRRKYCSKKCRRLSSGRKPLNRVYICEYCSKNFNPMAARRRFCSRNCSITATHIIGSIDKQRSRFLSQAESCKRKLERLNHKCQICGRISLNRTCSDKCEKTRACELSRDQNSKLKPVREIKCKKCGKAFTPLYGDKREVYCSKRCLRSQYSDPLRRQKYKKRLKGKYVSPVNKIEIAKRDGWRCGICGLKINRKLKWPNLKSLTVDHIIPLAKGGFHEPKNTQAAHFICNSHKRDLIIDSQMRLF